MSVKYFSFIVVFFILISMNSYSQNNAVDSLIQNHINEFKETIDLKDYDLFTTFDYDFSVFWMIRN